MFVLYPVYVFPQQQVAAGKEAATRLLASYYGRRGDLAGQPAEALAATEADPGPGLEGNEGGYDIEVRDCQLVNCVRARRSWPVPNFRPSVYT